MADKPAPRNEILRARATSRLAQQSCDGTRKTTAQQPAFELAALIRSQSANTRRARSMTMAAS
jgi:hypothetical protein